MKNIPLYIIGTAAVLLSVVLTDGAERQRWALSLLGAVGISNGSLRSKWSSLTSKAAKPSEGVKLNNKLKA